MAGWLVKEEPSHYSFDDLTRDGETEWDGVHNPLALRHLKAMRPGDEVFYYESGDRRSVVGVARVVSPPVPDARGSRGSWSVRVRPVRRLARPVSLAEIKADPVFRDFALVRIGRLTVMPVPPTLWRRILARAAR